MRIVAAGGGSGGHVTPVVAVLNELARLDTELEVHFICDKKFASQAQSLLVRSEKPVEFSTIWAGKLRRYHGISAIRQFLDVRTTAQNLFDLCLLGVGTVQSIWRLARIRPDVVFTKGGYVCVPVAVAARLLRIPIVMHDSDAHPGLANRIVAKWARRIATGAPLEYYPSYPKDRSQFVGTPVDRAYAPYDANAKRRGRTWLGFPDIERPLVVVTGGGLGARRINESVLACGKKLVDAGVSVYHITGQAEFEACESNAPDSVHYRLVPFLSERMVDALGSADVVVTRAGATTLLELAALHQAVIIVPNPYLTGGHQLKNASMYEKDDAALIFDEENLTDSDALAEMILGLVQNESRRHELGARIAAFAKVDAAIDVAHMIVDTYANSQLDTKEHQGS